MAEQEPEQPPRRISKTVVIGIFIAVFIAWLVTPFLLKSIIGGEDYAKFGQAGDLYGSINALFSGLAFAGVVIAILLQREELTLQRQELEYTRKELQRSADAQTASQIALNQTLYAQTLKVALDILNDQKMVRVREVLRGVKYNEKGKSFHTEEQHFAADHMVRSFNTIGTLVIRKLLPAEYVIDAWNPLILETWKQLERFIDDWRVREKDPLYGHDFEALATLAETTSSASPSP